ncbi:MAG: histidine phosphatase family protein [Synergistes sp.]|nr:histidine phosphatase family protein [Synergistes sp.]
MTGKTMTEKKRFFLMRHAKPQLPGDGRIYYGQTDYPLGEEGTADAEKTGAALSGIRFDCLYTSDMTRALQTAKYTAPYLEPHIVPALREISLGKWEGKGYDEVRSEFREIYELRGVKFAETAPLGGESFMELQKRTVPAFEKIMSQHESGNILIVAHAAVIWSITAHYLALDLNDMFFFPQNYCGIHIAEEFSGRLRLCRYNWSPELRF